MSRVCLFILAICGTPALASVQTQHKYLLVLRYDEAGARDAARHWRGPMPHGEFKRRFTLSESKVSSLKLRLRQVGFDHIEIGESGLIGFASANDAAALRAIPHRHVMVATTRGPMDRIKFAVPSGLRDALQAISVVDAATPDGSETTRSRRATATQCLRSVAIACYEGTYSGASLRTLYDDNSSQSASSTGVAIFASGGLGTLPTDLASYQASQLPSPATPIVFESVVSGTPVVSEPDPLNNVAPYVATDAVAEVLLSFANQPKLLTIYNSPTTDDLSATLMLERFVVEGTAYVGVMPSGICEELADLDGTMQADDAILLEGFLQGQTVFVGTVGYQACEVTTVPTVYVPGSVPDVPAAISSAPPYTSSQAISEPLLGYPATSPYVIAVGGTSIATNTNRVR